MLGASQEPEEVEVTVEPRADERREDSGGGVLFALGRVLFGGVLGFMALDNLRNLEERIGYAESKGTPLAGATVPLVSSSLLAGSLGLVLWRAPVAAASAVAAFFVGTTPVMHDFWAIDDDQEAQNQMFHFLKNLALLGATVAFLGLGKRRAE